MKESVIIGLFLVLCFALYCSGAKITTSSKTKAATAKKESTTAAGGILGAVGLGGIGLGGIGIGGAGTSKPGASSTKKMASSGKVTTPTNQKSTTGAGILGAAIGGAGAAIGGAGAAIGVKGTDKPGTDKPGTSATTKDSTDGKLKEMQALLLAAEKSKSQTGTGEPSSPPAKGACGETTTEQDELSDIKNRCNLLLQAETKASSEEETEASPEEEEETEASPEEEEETEASPEEEEDNAQTSQAGNLGKYFIYVNCTTCKIKSELVVKGKDSESADETETAIEGRGGLEEKKQCMKAAKMINTTKKVPKRTTRVPEEKKETCIDIDNATEEEIKKIAAKHGKNPKTTTKRKATTKKSKKVR